MKADPQDRAAVYDEGARDGILAAAVTIGFCTEKHGRLVRVDHDPSHPSIYHFEDGAQVFVVRDDLASVGQMISPAGTQFYVGMRQPGDKTWHYTMLQKGPRG